MKVDSGFLIFAVMSNPVYGTNSGTPIRTFDSLLEGLRKMKLTPPLNKNLAKCGCFTRQGVSRFSAVGPGNELFRHQVDQRREQNLLSAFLKQRLFFGTRAEILSKIGLRKDSGGVGNVSHV